MAQAVSTRNEDKTPEKKKGAPKLRGALAAKCTWPELLLLPDAKEGGGVGGLQIDYLVSLRSCRIVKTGFNE